VEAVELHPKKGVFYAVHVRFFMTEVKSSWFQMAFQVKGSVIPTIFPRILFCGGFAFVISLVHYFGYSLPEKIFGAVTSNVAYNLVLGLLLVFRTNTAYDRYWEGRKTWGGIVINTLNIGRNIKLSVAEIEQVDKDKKADVLRLLGAFGIATKLHLRSQSANSELECLVSQAQFIELKEVKNMPLKISLWIGDYLKQQQVNNRLSMDEFLGMNGLLNSLVEALVGCERIKRTPMPLAYAIYLKRLLLIYCVVLPFQLVQNLDWWTGPIVALISFILIAIEEIANQIQDPFGNDANDLPVDEICNVLVKNMEDLVS
jgi:ion channel-forming bestrophin family protein